MAVLRCLMMLAMCLRATLAGSEREAAYLEHTGVAALNDCCLMVQALDVSLQLLNVV